MHRPFRQRFTHVVKTSQGHKAFVEFGDPNASPRPRKEIQNLPHRTVSAGRNSVLRGGEIISWKGVRYLLVDQHTLTDMKRFLAAEITHEVEWKRSGKTIDPVARVERSGPPVVVDPALPVIMEPRSSIEEEGFEAIKYRVFTGADVKQGDTINDLKVKEVHDLFGIKMLEVI